jgi:hypothetical protein
LRVVEHDHVRAAPREGAGRPMVSSSLNSPSLGDGHRERDPDPDRLDAVVDQVKEQIEPPRAKAFGLEHFAIQPASLLEAP